MERPVKRLKITSPDQRSPRQTGSKMTEGLFTSEMGTRSDDEDGVPYPAPTRTISLSDLRRRYWPAPKLERRQVLPRGNRGILLRPRAPDATVTANVVEVNVSDGTSTVSAAEITVASDPVTVSLSSYTLTVPAPSPVTDITDTTTATSSDTSTSSISSELSSTLTASESTSSSLSLNAAASVFSAALFNSTISNTITSTSERTVTVTATSTFEISYLNGTYVTPQTTTDSSTSISHASSYSTKSSSQSSLQSASSHYTITSLATTSHASSAQSSTINSYSDSSSTPLAPPFASQSTHPGYVSPTLSSPSSTSSTASSETSSVGGPGLTPVQQQVVGGVVGAVGGLALVLLLLLIVLRWYRRRLKTQNRLPEQIAAQGSRNLTSAGTGTEMSQRSSGVPLAAAMASNFKRWTRPHSAQTFATTATGSTAPESERGFQRIAGRKIAPVLSSGGGDQYGGNYGAFEKETATDSKNVERGLAGSSFYRDNSGFYHGRSDSSSQSAVRSSSLPGSPTARYHQRGPSATRDFAEAFPLPPHPGMKSKSDVNLPLPNIHAATTVPRPLIDRAPSSGLGARPPEGYAAMRPSPARTPVMQSPNISQVRLSMPQGPERANMGIDLDAPPTPSLPSGSVWDAERGRLAVPSLGAERGVSQGSRGSGSRFREGLS